MINLKPFENLKVTGKQQIVMFRPLIRGYPALFYAASTFNHSTSLFSVHAAFKQRRDNNIKSTQYNLFIFFT